MTQALVTIVAALDPLRLGEAQGRIDALGNPARPDIAQRLDQLDGEAGIHFASLHALPSFAPDKAHLILEFSADGQQADAIARIARAIGGELAEIFALASDWRGGDIARYLATHAISTGYGIGANPGIGHSGSPGLTVRQIRAEATLSARISALLAEQPGDLCALDRIDAVRAAIAMSNPEALTPASSPPPYSLTGLIGAAPAAAFSFLRTYLWPWALAMAVVWALVMAAVCIHVADGHAWPGGGFGPGHAWHNGPLPPGWHLARFGVRLAARLIGVFVLGAVIVAGLLYLRLRQKEATDWTSSRAADPATLHAIIARENQPGHAQNHMVSLTEIKPGPLRRFTLRLAFWGVATIGPKISRPGYLGPIGTIHFARWITVPGTRDLCFFSNYGGSWEAYLEDFITLAHLGLTGVWSNTVGFPRTTNLIAGGASDGERFKRYARQSMQPTRFWYSAYPELTTDMIRVNADVRRGLSGAMTEDDAAAWLSRFGSAVRPADKLVTSEIQSLLFGGLGFLQHSTCTFWTLPAEAPAARAWLAEIARNIAWSDGRRVRDDERIGAICQLGLSASGLAALALPADGLATFPAAFLDGMDTEARARILGDVGGNARENWWWTGHADATVIVFGKTQASCDALRAHLDALAAGYGARLVREVPMLDYTAETNHEPFGFADGGSQPVIRGTYKGMRNAPHAMHVVEPGEFILGYPDNRGNLPPGPELPAILDPRNILPVVGADTSFAANDVNHPRDLGRNGSFLVIRELEQDVDAFWAYCTAEATRLKGRLEAPYHITADFIAAKLVGRWPNKTPLVRSPYGPADAKRHPEIVNANDFQFGYEDPEGLHCPFGAHIRRANPRDSLNPGSADQIAITNRHRILRVGRKYAASQGQNPGLLFMCLNGDIERQFEFIQQTWINGNVISLACPMNLAGERDPVIGGAEPNTGFTIPTRDGPVKLSPMQRFVTMRGGGYFFLPGQRLVRYLSETA